MSDERLTILQMIADGKISPEQGAELLKTLDLDQGSKQESPGGARWLCVRIFELNTDEAHNIRLPIGWAGKLLKFANHFAPNQIDFAEISEAIQSGELGQIIEVTTEDGNRVEIWLEA